MKMNFLLVFALFMWTGCLQAQSIDKNSKVLYLNSSFGIQMPDFEALNSVLSENGYLPLNDIHFSRGGGFFTIFPKIPLATIFSLSTYTASRGEDGKHNWVRSTQAGTSLGLVVRNNQKFQLIPYGGLIYSLSGVRVSNQNPNGGTFNSYISGPPNQLHISTNQFMANFGVQVAHKNLGKSKLSENLILGLKAGYFLPLGNQAWKTQNLNITEGPKVNTGGFYTSLIIGFAQ